MCISWSFATCARVSSQSQLAVDAVQSRSAEDVPDRTKWLILQVQGTQKKNGRLSIYKRGEVIPGPWAGHWLGRGFFSSGEGGVLFLGWWTTLVVCEARMLGGSGGMPPRNFLNFILSEVASGGPCDPNLQPYCIQHVAA